MRIENGKFYGPANYMKEQGNQDLDNILKGKDEMFNQCKHMSPSIETALCVWMQTRYAEWKGRKEMNSWV